jgi:hypothetical protein
LWYLGPIATVAVLFTMAVAVAMVFVSLWMCVVLIVNRGDVVVMCEVAVPSVFCVQLRSVCLFWGLFVGAVRFIAVVVAWNVSCVTGKERRLESDCWND